MLTIYVVDSPLDTVANDGVLTLREAILAANSSGGLDDIDFNIAGAGPHTIQPTSPLPAITDPVDLDATTQPGSTLR